MRGRIHATSLVVLRRARKPWLACGILFAVTVALSGCTSPREYIRNGFKVGPNYAKPPAPVETKWIDEGNPRLKSQTPENVEWWTILGDPVLNDLIGRAYANNPTLQQAAFRVLQFQAQRAIAVGNLLPQTQQATGSYIASGVSKENANTTFLPTRFFNGYAAGFNLSWELDFWGRLRRNLESATASLDATIEDYDEALVTLIGNVASTYVNIRTFQTRIKLASDNLKLQRETYEIAEARFKAGKSTKIDVDQALTNLSQVESLIPVLQIGQRQAENQLCTLLGISVQDLAPVIGTAPIPKIPPDIVVGIPAELLRRRPDVLAAERRAAAQSALIGVAQAELYPHIAINGTISWQAQHFPDLFNSQAMAGSVGPAFQWNILNYGRLVNGVRVQDALFRQLVLSYQATVLRAEAEAENGITIFLKGHQVVRALAAGAIASEEGARLGAILFKEGKIDFVALALLQQNLLTQQDNLATAYGNMVQGLIQTYQALGGGWQIRLSNAGQATEETPPPAPNQVPDINPRELPMEPPPAPEPGGGTGAANSAAPPRAQIDFRNVRLLPNAPD